MGLAKGLVKRVFSKSPSSTAARDGNERNFGIDKSKWSSVRIYFCGDEFNSLLAEDDLASVKSSEATVMQPLGESSGGEGSSPVTKTEEHEEEISQEENSPTKLLGQEDAAVLIQSAFRGFLAKRRYEQIRQSRKAVVIGRMENPSEASVCTSIEVQVGDSVENLRLREESVAIQHRVQHKARTQVSRLKEEWDDSTLSSNLSKLRIQNRLEATTRRERALAYAFSQQLRTCTSKKRSAKSDSTEPNMGWSWLERWMATRLPENSLVEDCLSKHLEPISTERRSIIIKKRFDLAVEEKESCGSNDVSVNYDSLIVPSQTPNDGYGPVKNRLKAARSESRRKTAPNYHYPMRATKASKGDSLKEAEQEKRCKQVLPKDIEETKGKDPSQEPLGCE